MLAVGRGRIGLPRLLNWKSREEDGHGAAGELDHSQLLTDPDEAADFVKKAKVDALAIAIGTSHGAYKFARKPSSKVLRIDRVRTSTPDSKRSFGHARSSRYGDWTAMISMAVISARPMACPSRNRRRYPSRCSQGQYRYRSAYRILWRYA